MTEAATSTTTLAVEADPSSPSENVPVSSSPGLTRIAITAVLVVILFVVWVLQKKGPRPS